ncbi:MAG TPA: hypothetical protein VIM99_09295, partial [Blastocatellia bacterium]
MTDELRIFQRRRLQQSGQAGEQRLFLMIRDDDLDERLASGLALEDGFYKLKTRGRVLAIT